MGENKHEILLDISWQLMIVSFVEMCILKAGHLATAARSRAIS
jgi:hypothetical protein